MINQAAVEALYSANYVVNYTDCVENLPDEIQRLVSRIRELDVTYQSYLKEVEHHQPIANHMEDDLTRKRTYQRIQKALIAAQEVGDEKLQVGQLIQDLIENKVRQLDTDYKNLDLSKDQENTEPNKETHHHHNISNVREPSNASTSATPAGGERQSKRARRSRVDTITTLDTVIPPEVLATPEPAITRGGNAAVVAATATNNNTTSNNNSNNKKNSTGKKKKRKARQSQQSQQQQLQQRDDTPPREDELVIDPDEPTYCLCDQISYGEMILCDNDLCPIEWFHFSCVSLATKPKGKWFCPKCRGDRPNIMKPKGQFLKELERYNKEKEEKA